nr:MAG TPA: hypothetical protein [Caudoviricetes sp.]
MPRKSSVSSSIMACWHISLVYPAIFSAISDHALSLRIGNQLPDAPFGVVLEHLLHCLFLHLPHGMVHGRAGGTGHRHKFLIGFPAFLSAGGIVFVSWYTKLPLNHADMPRLKFHKEALALATRASKVNHRAAFQDVCLEKGRRITDRRTHVGFCGAGSEIAQVCPECAGVVFHNGKDCRRAAICGFLPLAQVFDHAFSGSVEIIPFLHFLQHQLSGFPRRGVDYHFQCRRGFVRQHSKGTGNLFVVDGKCRTGSVVIGFEIGHLFHPLTRSSSMRYTLAFKEQDLIL